MTTERKESLTLFGMEPPKEETPKTKTRSKRDKKEAQAQAQAQAPKTIAERTNVPCVHCVAMGDFVGRDNQYAIVDAGEHLLCQLDWEIFGKFWRAKYAMLERLENYTLPSGMIPGGTRPALRPSTAADGYLISSTPYTDDMMRLGMLEFMLYGTTTYHICPRCDTSEPKSDLETNRRAEWLRLDNSYVRKGEGSRCSAVDSAKASKNP